jgi:hypothetical protein
MEYYKRLLKTTIGKILLLGILTLSITLGVIFVVNIEKVVFALLWWGFATFAIILLFLLAMVIILVVTDRRNLKTSHEIKERVKVLNKRQLCIPGADSSNDWFIDYITFEFPDGTSEEMPIGSSEEVGLLGNRIRSKSIFYITSINDTGILTYKILKWRPHKILTVPQEGESRKKFIGFEKD